MAIRPIKCMFAEVTDIQFLESWDMTPNFDDGTGDPWLSYPYRWTVTFRIVPQSHSDHTSTPVPFYFMGENIKVGDWLVFTTNYMAVKITNILTAGETMICEVEDVDRFNILSNPMQTGDGIGPISAPGTTDCLVIELGDDGLPMFFGVAPGLIPAPTQSEIVSRFRYRNYQKSFRRVNQPEHTMEVGDAIYLKSDGMYEKAMANTGVVDRIVGHVNSVGTPGPNWFTFKPIGEVIDGLQLPGNLGDLIYVSPNIPGKLTEIRPTSHAVPVYIKIDTDKGIMVDRPDIDAGRTDQYTEQITENDKTIFILPEPVQEILTFGINGMETSGFVLQDPTTVEFDPIVTGYGLEIGDEVIILYRT